MEDINKICISAKSLDNNVGNGMPAEDFRQEISVRGYCLSSGGKKWEAEPGQWEGK